ncbi:MAG TPA: pyridoxal-phosphate dependent enzyme [Cellvibrionaceae bacterium]
MHSHPSKIYALAQRAAIQPVSWSRASAANCRIWVKRDDLLHEAVSGNKLFKLFYYLHEAAAVKSCGIISFGGAYSNHLYALAKVAQAINLPSVGIIRGEECDLQNPTLAELNTCGMQLQRVDRTSYRHKTSAEFNAQLTEQYPGYYLIPEGGAGVLGAQGFADYAEAVSAQLINNDLAMDSIWLPAGTGTSVAGLAARWHNIQAVCALALNEPATYTQAIAAWTRQLCQAQPSLKPYPIAWHGFALPFGKLTASILEACRAFWCETGLLFDPIYGGKVLLALQKAFDSGLRNQHILIIHTGGVQGWRGFFSRKNNIPDEIEHAVTAYFADKTSFILDDTDLTLGI